MVKKEFYIFIRCGIEEVVHDMPEKLQPCFLCKEIPTVESFTGSYTPRFYIYCPIHSSQTIVMSHISLNKAIEQWNTNMKEKSGNDQSRTRAI